jgi:hypothetical protein
VFVARDSVLIVLEPTRLFVEFPALAPDREGRCLPERTEAKARVGKGRRTLKKKLIAWSVTMCVCKDMILGTIELGQCCSNVGHEKCLDTLLFGCVKLRRGSGGGEGAVKCHKLLNGVHDSLTKGSIDKSRKAEVFMARGVSKNGWCSLRQMTVETVKYGVPGII